MTGVELGPYRLGVATGFGPRVTSLRCGDGPELLARLDEDRVLAYPGGVYRLRGGHRLWAAPEVPEVTYASDDHACVVSTGEATVAIRAPVDSAGLGKEISVALDGDSLLVEHRISAPAATVGAAAAWGITQLPLGGVAILPLTGADTAPLPNRHLVLWPYTSLADSRLSFLDTAVRVAAQGEKPLKLGTGPHPSRLGYLREGRLFLKEAVAASVGEVPDLGASNQVYVGQGFCELETVGGLVSVADGGTATLTERWTVLDCASVEEATRTTLEGGK